MSTVYVSGATGYIAQHIVKLLLENSYTVIGSVRSSAKGDALAKLLQSPKFSYEIVEDVGKEGAFDESLKKHPEVDVFLHTASPFHFHAVDVEKELLTPAVQGTQNALKAIVSYGKNIKKVVVTSSYAAIATAGYDLKPEVTLTEESWNEITWEEAKKDPRSGYRGSKKFAEKAAWDFVKENDVGFTINYINPSFVFGPQAFSELVKENLNTSSEILNSLLKAGPNGEVPQAAGGFIDVRDVAKAHLVAFEKEGLKNQRLILNEGRFTCQQILDVLNSEVPQLKGHIPVGTPGDYKDIKWCAVDNSKTREILGFKFIGLKQTVVDSLTQILEAQGKL